MADKKGPDPQAAVAVPPLTTIAGALESAEEAARMKRIEDKLSLPHGYYDALVRTGSDWEFAIKLVVVIEAALGKVIAAHLRNSAVIGHCERLSLDGRAGKLTLAQDLGLLLRDEARAISATAFVRNSFAHRVENIEGNLMDYVKALSKDELPRLVKHLLMVTKEREKEVNFLWTSEHTPSLFRHMLWTSGSIVLDSLARHDMKAEEEAERLRRIEQGWQLEHGGLSSLFKGQRGPLSVSSLTNFGWGDQADAPFPLHDAAKK